MATELEFTATWALYHRMSWDSPGQLEREGLAMVRANKSGPRLRVIEPRAALAALKVPGTMSVDGTWPRNIAELADRLSREIAGTK